MTIDSIRKLTDWQVRNIYFLPALRRAARMEAAESGYELDVPKKNRKQRNPRQMSKADYFQVGEKLGCSPEMMERQWNEYLDDEKVNAIAKTSP